MLKIILARPGATDFDDQGRIKGSLDMPMSDCGKEQVRQTAQDLETFRLHGIFSAPCQSAMETAKVLACGRDLKIKTVENFREYRSWSVAWEACR